MKRRLLLILLSLCSFNLLFASLTGKLIVVDPGHGGKEDRGATGTILEEADINLKVAKYLRELLEECGATVIMTRTSDRTVSLAERANLANRIDADLFVSIHFNSMKNTPNSDFSIAYYSAYSADYARNVADYLIESFKKYVGTSGDAGPGDVYLMREVKVPAVLGEPCHVSNEEREQWLNEEENLKAVAIAYKEAICRLFDSEIPELNLEAVEEINSWDFNIDCSQNIDKAFAFFDKQPLDVEIQQDRLFISVPENISPGKYFLTAYAIGKNGVYSKKYTKWIQFNPPVDSVKIEIFPDRAPAIAGSYYKIDLIPYARRHCVDKEPLSVKVSDGFITKSGNSLIIPYMGIDEVCITVSYEATELTVPLLFSGDTWVEVVSIYSDDGTFLGIIENTGEPVTISYDGYERVIYNQTPVKPVSFKSIRVNRTLEGFLKGKKIIIAASERKESFEKIAQILQNYGCDAEIVIVQSKRDEINLMRRASSVDFIFLISLNINLKPRYETFFLSDEKELDRAIELLKKAGGIG